MSHAASNASGDSGEAEWMSAYTAVLSNRSTGPKKADGPGCCPICCTMFSIGGALFLFVVAAAMKNHYEYLHIEGA